MGQKKDKCDDIHIKLLNNKYNYITVLAIPTKYHPLNSLKGIKYTHLIYR